MREGAVMKITTHVKVMNDEALEVPCASFEADTTTGALSMVWRNEIIELRRAELDEFLYRTQPLRAAKEASNG